MSLQVIIGARPITVRRAALDEIIHLRHVILRPGLPFETARFDGDEESTTLHFGAFVGDEPVGCVTFTQRPWQNQPAWQLRGMATAQGWQRKGIGRALMSVAESVLCNASDIRLMWCNARTHATAFYEKLGWQMASDEFVIQGVGAHYRMTKRL